MQQKIGERYRWGATPRSLAKMQGQGSAEKNWRALPLGGYPSSLGKMQGQGSAAKIGERYRWGATPLSLGKMQGQGSAVKSWSALSGNVRAGQCSKKIGERYRWGLPYIFGKTQGQGSAVKDWRALLGGYPTIFGKNAGAGQCSKNWRALLGGLPLYLAGAGQCWKKFGERYRWGATPVSLGKTWEPPYHKPLGIRDSVHLLTIVLPSAVATANRITEPGSASLSPLPTWRAPLKSLR